MQPRFERRTANSAYSLVEQPRFRAGFDFLRLRADAGEVPAELAEWWEDFSLGDDAEREALIEAVRETGRPKRGAAPKRAAPAASAAAPVDEPAGEPAAEQGAEAGDAADAPRKRRRRRRKPAGQRAGDAAPVAGASPGHDVGD